MSDFLSKIVASTQKRVALAKQRLSFEDLQRKVAVGATALGRPLNQGNAPFRTAIARPQLSFICEVKQASPSAGQIAATGEMGAAFPYLDIARSYEAAGADAISVLTEPEFFKGSDQYLRDIAAAVAVPVLRKDFVLEEYQVYKAALLGASAVLLIAAILDDAALLRLRELTEQLGMDALVEAHDLEEVKRALASGARIVGVNNRNLTTFAVDLRTSLELRSEVPGDVLYVAESGIRETEDVAALAAAGVDGVLIGETLMRAEDRAACLGGLRRAAGVDGGGRGRGVAYSDILVAEDERLSCKPLATAQLVFNPPPLSALAPGGSKIKICGLQRLADIEAANAALPDYAGFVFAPSKRQVTPQQAAELKAALDPRILAVGVFVDAPVQEVVALVQASTIDLVQLHGAEDAQYVATLRDAAPNTPTIKSLIVEQLLALSKHGFRDADPLGLPDYLLVDNAIAGSGIALDGLRADDADGAANLRWAIANAPLPVFLAGGVNTSNIGAALEFAPFAIDISSGAETDGRKDAGKIAELVQSAKYTADLTSIDWN